MHPQRLARIVIDAEHLNVAQSHQQLTHTPRVSVHGDPPVLDSLAAPILGDPPHSTAYTHNPSSDLIREKPQTWMEQAVDEAATNIRRALR